MFVYMYVYMYVYMFVYMYAIPNSFCRNCLLSFYIIIFHSKDYNGVLQLMYSVRNINSHVQTYIILRFTTIFKTIFFP
jgi:hypothetical protein